MTSFALPILLLAGLGAGVQEQPAKPPATTATGLAGDSAPLVKAAKDARAKKKAAPPRKVITNKDLKSGKTLKTSQAPPPAAAEEPKPPAAPQPSADEQYRSRKAAEERLAAAEKRLAELEADLGRIEQSYYDENDVVRRDTVIRKQFLDARTRLEEGRQAVTEARDALIALTPRSSVTVTTRP